MPPLASWNGILTHYSMTYTLINSAASPCNHSLNESRVVPVDLRRNVETVDDLIPFTQYWFQISAATRAGEGPVASLLCNTTQAGRPSLLMQQFLRKYTKIDYSSMCYVIGGYPKDSGEMTHRTTRPTRSILCGLSLALFVSPVKHYTVYIRCVCILSPTHLYTSDLVYIL